MSFISKEEKLGLVGSDGRTGEPGMTLDRSMGRVQRQACWEGVCRRVDSGLS